MGGGQAPKQQQPGGKSAQWPGGKKGTTDQLEYWTWLTRLARILRHDAREKGPVEPATAAFSPKHNAGFREGKDFPPPTQRHAHMFLGIV